METRSDTLTENPAPELTRARVGSLPVLPVAAAATSSVRRNPMRALRLPEQDDPAPGSPRMLGMSAWAALLVLVGGVVAIRVFLAIVFEPGPDWLVPTVMSIGIAGTVCGGLAFATVHHRWLPWELLGVASLLLGGNLLMVVTQL